MLLEEQPGLIHATKTENSQFFDNSLEFPELIGFGECKSRPSLGNFKGKLAVLGLDVDVQICCHRRQLQCPFGAIACCGDAHGQPSR